MKGLKIGKGIFSFSKTLPGPGKLQTLDPGYKRQNRQSGAGDPEADREQGEIIFLGATSEGKMADGGGMKRAAHLRAAAGEKLLESFPKRKNAEREEDWKRSESSHFADEDESTLKEVLILTRKELVRTLGPLNEKTLQDDSSLEKALGKIHRRLPLPVRLIFWKKRYIQFILDNRERLIP